MGLGKTVMAIALILSNPRGEQSNYIERDIIRPVRGRDTRTRTSTPSIRGGTLIVCPMALLGQWKVSMSTEVIHIKMLNLWCYSYLVEAFSVK